MSENIIVNTTSENIVLSVDTTTDHYNINVVATGNIWGTIYGYLSAQTDLYSFLTALSVSTASSNVSITVLSAGLDITNAFLAANSGNWNTAYQNTSSDNLYLNANTTSLSALNGFLTVQTISAANYIGITQGATDRLDNGTVQVILSTDNNLYVPNDLYTNGSINTFGQYLSSGVDIITLFGQSGDNSVNSLVHNTSADWNTAYQTTTSLDTNFSKLSTQAYILSGTNIRPVLGNNTASGSYAVIGGGYHNISAGDYSIVAGGCQNYITQLSGTEGCGSTISGGYSNCICHVSWASVIGGGGDNLISDCGSSVIAGGWENHINANSTCSNAYGAIGGGIFNNSCASNTTIGGGCSNIVKANNSGILGGYNNIVDVSANDSFIIGSNITAVSANYTYVNNLSSQGTINTVSVTFGNGSTQTTAFTGVNIPPSDRLDNGTVQVILSSDNLLHFPNGTNSNYALGGPGGFINLIGGPGGDPGIGGNGGCIYMTGGCGHNTNGGSAGNINTSGAGDMFGVPGLSGGSIDTSNGGGNIITRGYNGAIGGYIDTSSGSYSADGYPVGNGGCFIAIGGHTEGHASGGSAGWINISGGYATDDNGGSGGCIDLRGWPDGGGNGGCIIMRGSNGWTQPGSINTSACLYNCGGNINTSASNTLNGGDGGYINTSGGKVIENESPSGASGASNGGYINTSGAVSDGNYSASGGYINTSAGTGSNNYDASPGGYINTSGGAAILGVGGGAAGGYINTSAGGGSINTTGSGYIQFGYDTQRTTLSGTATENRNINLPDASGTLVLTNDLSSFITAVSGTPNQIDASKSGSTVTLSLPNSAIFPGDVSIIGNLTIAGSATYIDAKNLVVGDNLIYFNDNNYGANVLDIGLVAHFSQAPLGYNHTGLVRRAGGQVPGIWTLFSGLTTEPLSAANIDWTDKNIRIDSLSANLIGNVTGNADTVTNGVYTNQSYSDPSWIASLADTKITGTKFTTNTTTNTLTGLLTPLTTTNTLSSLLTLTTTTNTLTGLLVKTTDLNTISATLLTRTDANTLTGQLVTNTTFNSYQTNVAAATALLTPLTLTRTLTSQLVLNTAINTLTGNWNTAYASTSALNLAGYDSEIHVSQIDGNDTTGNGDLLKPVASITKALT